MSGDMLDIMTSLPVEQYVTYHAALQAGPEVTAEDVIASNPRWAASRTREGIEQDLAALVPAGVMACEDGRYKSTPDALRMTIASISNGCSDEEVATTSEWLRVLVNRYDETGELP